jgi:hypothetical protein
MKPKFIGTIVGVAVTPIALFLALVSSGAGHGDYLAARLLFPASMLTAALFGQMTAPALLLSFVQFPTYGWLFGESSKPTLRWLWLAPVVFHVLMLAFLFMFPDAAFS